MTTSEAFTETLVANGLTNIFGIVGSAFMDALDIFPAAGKLLQLFITSAASKSINQKLNGVFD